MPEKTLRVGMRATNLSDLLDFAYLSSGSSKSTAG